MMINFLFPRGCTLHGKFCCLSVQFCEVITVSWLKHLSGRLVRILLDYVDHVTLCAKMKATLMEQKEWTDICRLQGDFNIIISVRRKISWNHNYLSFSPPENVRCLKHLCRLRIRQCLGRLCLRSPIFMSFLPLPERLKNYILYREYDMWDGQSNSLGWGHREQEDWKKLKNRSVSDSFMNKLSISITSPDSVFPSNLKLCRIINL